MQLDTNMRLTWLPSPAADWEPCLGDFEADGTILRCPSPALKHNIHAHSRRSCKLLMSPWSHAACSVHQTRAATGCTALTSKNPGSLAL